VRLLNGVNSAARPDYMRAAIRVNSRVKVVLDWTVDGQRYTVEGYTVEVSPKGCMVVVPQEFVVGQRLRLTNPANNCWCEALLIWRGQDGRKGWEVGFELEDPPTDFWRVEF
jgi:hypothetical protein